MGLRPTRGNENQRRHPREGGGPFFTPMDSRFRGNDVIFEGATGDEESRTALERIQSEIPRGFTLSAQSEIPSLRSGQALRCAQDDSEGLRTTA
jgi:hypothetical protein